MNDPLVSVIMPVYNSGLYLKSAVDSILNQSYENIELIIVNDGSTDKSREIILSYSDPRIFLYDNTVNEGIVFSRNRGLELAKGKYAANLDSDDLAVHERLDKQVKFMEKNPDYAMCGTFYIRIDGRGDEKKKIEVPTSAKDVHTYLTIGNCICNSSVMVRSDLAKTLKYRIDFPLGEDYDLWWRLSRRSKIGNLPFYGTNYRVHNENISVSKLDEMLTLLQSINKQILSDLKIPFDESELYIHTSFLNRNVELFKEPKRLAELEKWVVKFFNAMKTQDNVNLGLLYKLLAEKWIVIVFHTGQYNKLIFNTLISSNRSLYMKSLMRRIFVKWGLQKD